EVLPGRLGRSSADIGLAELAQRRPQGGVRAQLPPEPLKEPCVHGRQALPELRRTVIQAGQLRMVSMDILHVLNPLQNTHSNLIEGLNPLDKVGFAPEPLLLCKLLQVGLDVLHCFVQHEALLVLAAATRPAPDRGLPLVITHLKTLSEWPREAT